MRRYQVEYSPAPEDRGARGTYRERQRTKWGTRPEFFAVLTALVVDQTVIRIFPYMCFKNGGALFLVPYLLFMLVFSVPLMVMEAGLGQFAGVSALTMWRAVPLFKGVGFAVLVTTTLWTALQGVSMAHILYYLYSSASKYVPWSHCNNQWNTAACRLLESTAEDGQTPSQTPGYEYWMNEVLRVSEGVEDAGDMRYPLLVCLAAGWGLVLLVLCAGTRTLGKVAYCLVILTFTLLAVLVGRGLTLPGAFDGLLYLVRPDVSSLLSLPVWLSGAVRAFWSLGAGFAVIVTMSSYNRFRYNSYRAVLLLPLVLLLANVLGGVMVFAFVGYRSSQTGLSPNDMQLSGPELSYITMAETMASLPIAQLWSALYFSLDLCLTLSSQVVMVQVVVSSITDEAAVLGRHWCIRFIVLFFVCGISFTLGVPCVTQGGLYVWHMLEISVTRFGPYFCTVFQCIGIAWVYGMNRLYGDMELMLGKRPCVLWKAFWCCFCPLIALALIVGQMLWYQPLMYMTYIYPLWAEVVSWLVALIPILLILLGMVFQLARFSGKSVKEVVKPTEKWAPLEGRERPRFTPSAPPATGTMEMRGPGIMEIRQPGTMDMRPPPYVECEKAWAY